MIANYWTSGAGRDPYLRQEGGRSSRKRNEKENHTKSLTSSIVRHVPLSAYVSRNVTDFFSSISCQFNGRKGFNRDFDRSFLFDARFFSTAQAALNE